MAMMTTDADLKERHLRGSEIFQDLTPEQVHEIAKMAPMTTCSRGRVFYRPEDAGEVLFILKAGSVALYRVTEDGRKVVTGTVRAGSIFREMSMLGQGLADSYAEALEDCTICVMSRDDVIRLIGRFPSVAVRVLDRLASRLREAEERLADMAYRPVQARVAGALLRLADDTGDVRVSHQDLAEIAGTQRETVTRALNQLRHAGIIEVERLHIHVRDRGGLAAASVPATDL